MSFKPLCYTEALDYLDSMYRRGVYPSWPVDVHAAETLVHLQCDAVVSA